MPAKTRSAKSNAPSKSLKLNKDTLKRLAPSASLAQAVRGGKLAAYTAGCGKNTADCASRVATC